MLYADKYILATYRRVKFNDKLDCVQLKPKSLASS